MSNSLQAILNKAASQPEKKPAKGRKPRYAALAKEFNVPAADFERKKSTQRPCRKDQVFIGGHFKPSVRHQLKAIANDDFKSVQELLEEALDLLFIKRGRDKIAKL